MKKALSVLLIFAMMASLLLPALLSCKPDTPPDAPEPPDTETPAGQKLRDEYVAIPAEGHEDGPYLIETVWQTEHVIVADIIATNAPYSADPTGQTDSTAAIQSALNACAKQGGGTVFLPAGRYLVTATLEVPHGVVLQGDWQDPDLAADAPEYGTIILADLPALQEGETDIPDRGVLFYMMSSGIADNGLIGLTVYYPNQSISDVKPYGYTVYGTLSMTMLRDLTFINSYRGIGTCLAGGGHELLQIENVRMTALEYGYRVRNSSEVGYTTDLRISPSYWSEAGEGFACSDAEALRSFCRANTVGMACLDLDLNQYSTIFIESCHTALLFSEGFWGAFYDVEIKDSIWGVVAQDTLFHTAGVLIANAEIEAEKYAVINYAADTGMIKLADVQATGKGGIHAVEGARIMIDNADDLAVYEPRYKTYSHPVAKLYVADVSRLSNKRQDAAPTIQETLDAAAQTGGVVYVPRGVYSLYTPLTVPEGVELRGAMSMAMRDNVGAAAKDVAGTVFLTYVNEGDGITLLGNCGISGIRIFYPSYDMGTAQELLDANEDVTRSHVAIRGKGANVYAVNMVISCAFVGIDFTNCDNHFIKQTFGCCYRSFIRAGGEGGYIESVLANQSFTMRQPFWSSGCFDPKYVNEENWEYFGVEMGDRRFSIIRDCVLRPYCDTVELIGAVDEEMNNVFMYGCRRILKADNSSVRCYNVTSDWQSLESMFLVENSSNVVAINPYRTSGMSHECDESSSLLLYNRIVNGSFYEPTYRSSTGLPESVGGRPSDKIMLLDEQSLAGITGAVSNRDAAFIKEGNSSLKQADPASRLLLRADLDGLDASELGDENVYLHMWIHVDETTHLNNGGTIKLALDEAGLGGIFLWYTETYLQGRSGWSELWLSLADGWRGVGGYDLGSLHSLQVDVTYNHMEEYAQFYIDDVYLCYVSPHDELARPIATAEAPSYLPPLLSGSEQPSRVMIHDCETTEYLTGLAGGRAELNTDPEFVKQGNASFRVTPSRTSIIELTFPDSNLSDYDENGYLHMWLYVDDLENITTNGQFELCSGGICDVGEKTWQIAGTIKKNGWNELWLPLSSAGVDKNADVAYSPFSVNYLRFYINAGKKAPTIYIDDIYVCNYKGADLYDESNTLEVGQTAQLVELPMLNAAESPESTEHVMLNTNPDYVKQGKASFRSTGTLDRLVFRFPDTDVSAYADGYLHLWLWVDDASKLTNGQLELTSSGECDNQENGWSLSSAQLRDGWNELWLPMHSDFTQTGGGLDLTRLNFLRIYWFEESATQLYFDDIRFVAGDSEEAPESSGGNPPSGVTEDQLPVLLSGEFRPARLELGNHNTNAAYVKVGTGSIKGADQIDRVKYIFAPLDVSEYMDGALELWVHAEDASDITIAYLELSSSGTFDNEEISWSIAPLLTEDGWNHLSLSFSDCEKAGVFDPTHLNFLRIFVYFKDGTSQALYFDDIRFVAD